MKQTYERPFRPVEVTDSLVASFALPDMGQQLMQEEVFDRLGRDSLTLVRSEALTVVLFVLNAHAELPDHQAPGPIAVTVLSGEIEFRTQDGADTLLLGTGDVGLCAAHKVHSVTARDKSIVLLVIGGQA
ncbi:MAG: hypothetical protein F4Y37_03740 [Caldilineaceae bacterium SB0664_bin_22]|nr:hypothetical protein [Caldilineaceae bacterium SB0664_bin_22]